jgi:type IV fimbrial biogenesis protein FimT
MSELLMVIVMIGAMAAMASPVFIDVMRDRRVNQAATQAAEVYRMARARALGRGSAVMVRWVAGPGAGEGSLFMREAVQGGVNGPLPTSNCTTTDWTVASVNSRAVTHLEFVNGAFGLAQFAMSDASGPIATSEFCFSPRGRTFYRTTAGWSPLADVPKLTVVNKRTPPALGGRERVVYIPPNGAARLAL